MSLPSGAPNAATAAAIRAEQVRLLFGSPGITLLNLLNAVLATALLAPVFPAVVVIGWISLVTLIIAARGLLWRRYQRAKPHAAHAARWGRAFMLGTAATGCVWGLLGSVVFFTKDPVNIVFAAFLLGGITAGSSLRDAAWPPAFYAFAAPAILPMVLGLLLQGDRSFMVMAVLMAAFALVAAIVGFRNSRWIGENVRLRIEQASLNESLQHLTANLQRQADETARAATKLKDSNDRVLGIAESAQDAMILIDGSGAITFWNPAAERIFGYVPGEIVGQDFRRLIGDETERANAAAFQRASRTGVNELQGRVLTVESVRKDGSRFPLDMSVSIMPTVEGWNTLVIGRDVSERQRAERDIADLHERMRANLEALRRHELNMTMIAKLSDMLQACRSRAEAYPIIETVAKSLFDGTSGGLSIVSEDMQELETVTAWGAAPDLSPSFGFADCWALRTGQRYEVTVPNPATACAHFTATQRDPYVCLPLTVQGETSGLLHLSLPAGKVMDDDLHRVMSTFGDVVKLSLSNLKLRESLSEQAMRDQLTMLFNRRYLAETLPREIRRAERDRTDLTVAMIDVDDFKQFNDSHGHGAGDVVLKELGAFLQSSLRAGDIACRYGGEEFLLVLPECDVKEARARLDRLRLDISMKTIAYRRRSLPFVTVSMGLAQSDDGLSSAEGIIAAADHALYEAKRKGRNRIEIFTGAPIAPPPGPVAPKPRRSPRRRPASSGSAPGRKRQAKRAGS